MTRYLPTSAKTVRELLFIGHWDICFAKNNGNVSTLICQMTGRTMCRISDSWRGWKRMRYILLLRGFTASYDDNVFGFALRVGPGKNVIQVWCKVA